MWGVGRTGKAGWHSEGKNQEKLDRALVAGLILEVVLEQPDLPQSWPARQRAVKSRIQTYLVQHLAGSISLDRFRFLVQHLDGWFDYYFPLVAPEGRSGGTVPRPGTYSVQEERATYMVFPAQGPAPAWTSPAAPDAQAFQACRDELLDQWLATAGAAIPQRSHRKLTPRKLKSFLVQSGGRWFRLRDFERYVQMDRKTAWDYLQQFLQAGLLCHNRKNSAAVRYCLAPAFLKVEADALRLALSLGLADHPEEIIEKISDFLIATGGAPFHRQQWEEEFPDPRQAAWLEELTAQEIIVRQQLPTGSQFFQLHSRWLHQQTHPGQDPTAAVHPSPRP